VIDMFGLSFDIYGLIPHSKLLFVYYHSSSLV
jgi:hypothetical protein